MIRLFILSVLVLGVLASCTSSRKPTPTRPTRPVPGKPTTNVPVDTIKWTEVDKKPPIQSSGKPDVPSGNTGKPNNPAGRRDFNIAVLLPFVTDKYDETTKTLPDKSEIALQFYGGMKLALERISIEKKLNLTINVLDTQLGDTEFSRVLSNTAIDKADIIIGPVRPTHITALANRTKIYHKPIISFYSQQVGLVKDYPEFVQINPSLQSHCEAIANHILSRYSSDRVVLIAREKEQERLEYLQAVAVSKGKPRMTEMILPDNTTNLTKDLKSFFRTDKGTVFVIPSWSSQDFINGVLTKIKQDKGKNAVEVYGMPQWEDFENIEPELYEADNVHITREWWYDSESEEVKTFKQAYFAQYRTVPSEHAFNGYDVTMWLALQLERNGQDWIKKLTSANTERGLSKQFKIFPNSIGVDGASEGINYLENKSLYLLRFDDYRFEPIK